MMNFPQSSSQNRQFGFKSSGTNPTPISQAKKDELMAMMEKLLLQLRTPELRESALLNLAKAKEFFQQLAPVLWNSFGTIAALLQEIVSIYPVLSPPNLSPEDSDRVCNALALLQCVASDPDTRMLFLNAQIPLYMYPFIKTTSKTRPFEYLRLTSLGVIGALVKVEDAEVVQYLLKTEIMPLCLNTMETGSELAKTVAIFIVQKILLDEAGLVYMSIQAERCFALARVLRMMVQSLAEQPSSRTSQLLKYIIRCYLRLSEKPRSCQGLQRWLPMSLRGETFSEYIADDTETKEMLRQLIINVDAGPMGILLRNYGGGFNLQAD